MIPTPSFIVRSFILVVLLAAVGATLMPEFRGGIFVTWVAAIIATLLGCVIILEAARSALSDGYPEGRESSAAVGEAPESARPLTAMQIGKVFWFSAVFFVPIVLLGVYFGSPVGIAWILYRHCGARRGFAVILAVAAGTVLPVLFTAILSTTLWPGVLPEIIPDWLGGGILPPI